MPKINDELTVLGDVHLGRKFRTNVPLHRIGEREEMVWAQFEAELNSVTTPLLVQMGDLFESFSVEEAVVLRAFEIIKRAAERNPQTQFIFLRGNHDASRDTNKKSSFDVLAELFARGYNVRLMQEAEANYLYYFLPWHPFKSANELLQGAAADAAARDWGKHPVKGIFCHCDVKSYGGSEFNLVPTKLAAELGVQTIYTGHVHLPTTFEQDGVTVNVVGSMAPYAHGEDPDDTMYQTLSAEEVLEGDLARFKNVNLRVTYVEQIPLLPEIDCLSLSFKKLNQVEEGEEADIEVSFENFDMQKLFQESLTKFLVGSEVSDKILQKFNERRNHHA